MTAVMKTATSITNFISMHHTEINNDMSVVIARFLHVLQTEMIKSSGTAWFV